MKQVTMFFVVVVLISHAIGALAQPPDTLWTRTYGGISNDYGNCVQQTDDGGYIVAGYTLSYGAGSEDVYLIKTDALGDTVWTRTCGGSDDDKGNSIQQTSDGGYIVAGSTQSYGAGNNDVYLIKTDDSGSEEWVQTFGGTGSDVGYSVQQTSDGGYIVAGYTSSYGAGSSDVYLIKTGASGNEEWTQTCGGTGTDGGGRVQQTSDGGYIVAEYTSSYGAGSYDFYLIKTNASGDTLWTQIFGGTGNDQGRSVQQTTDGGYIVAGYTVSFGAGGNDFYLIKTDGSGSEEWVQTFGGTGSDVGYSVQQTSDGCYVTAGYTGSYGAGSNDFYLIKTDALGDTLWTRTCGGSGSDQGRSVQQTQDGGYIVAGHTMSYGAGSRDVYLVRLEAEAPPDLSVTLTPHDPPIVIPASGGSFLFDVAIENTTASPITADAWIEAVPPGGTAVPLIVRTGITFPASGTITRPDLNQNVPAGAPPGIYTYRCSVGEYLVSSIDFDQFTFEKLAAGEGLIVDDWNLSGWEEETFVSVSTPEKFAFIGPHPNPFNPTTTIRFDLPAAGWVKLEVFDVAGRVVGARSPRPYIEDWRDAGTHEITFDGSELPSGMYIVKLKTEACSVAHKIVLLK